MPLHVTNGDSVAHKLAHVAPHGPVVSWRDALHDGPVPRGDAATVRAARAAFLAEAGFGNVAVLAREMESRDDALDAGLAHEDEVVLWFEHDLYDQLQLVQVLARAAGHPRAGALRLISIDRHPAHPHFRGLGELAMSELTALWPARRPVAPAALAAATAVWDALRAPDPRALAVQAARSVPELPFLEAALLRLLEELPSTDDGLSRSEWHVLRAVAAGASTPITVFHDAAEAEEAPFLGDTWCFRRIHDLAAGPTPLLAVAGGGPLPLPPPRADPAPFLSARLELTPAGRSVLVGAGDRVALVPFDRWLGGTHLTLDAAWRLDAAHGELVAP